MKTNDIEKLTKIDFSDPVEEITSIPRPIVAMAKEFPNGKSESLTSISMEIL